MDANQAIANSAIRFRIRMGLSRPQEVSAPHKERLLLSLYDVVLSLQWVRRDIIFCEVSESLYNFTERPQKFT